MATTLVITNDFPPRIGGIESFVGDVCGLLDDGVVVLTSQSEGAEGFDATLAYPVVRRGSVLLPTPTTARVASDLLRAHRATRVVYGAMAPLALLAGGLRRAGAEHQLGLTHGHEVWWATVPGARGALRRMGTELDHVATISDYASARIGPALTPFTRDHMLRIAPPVDVSRFVPGPRHREGRTSSRRPRAIAVSRFVRQKGLETLLDAWTHLLATWDGPRAPELVLVGAGPLEARLRRRVRAEGLSASVRFTGPLPRVDVVAHLQDADVFVLPVRTRFAGLNPEGLGLGFVEAAACGLPVVVGRSGGAPETVVHEQTGYVVDSLDSGCIADRVGELFRDQEKGRRMGAAGRVHVTGRYGFDRTRRVLRAALALD